jgi:hypothetical protein
MHGNQVVKPRRAGSSHPGYLQLLQLYELWAFLDMRLELGFSNRAAGSAQPVSQLHVLLVHSAVG